MHKTLPREIISMWFNLLHPISHLLLRLLSDKIADNCVSVYWKIGISQVIHICYLILYRDDGSGMALRNLKRVQKGWGQGSISSLQPQRNDFSDSWDTTD